jgi:hypothetical protein
MVSLLIMDSIKIISHQSLLNEETVTTDVPGSTLPRQTQDVHQNASDDMKTVDGTQFSGANIAMEIGHFLFFNPESFLDPERLEVILRIARGVQERQVESQQPSGSREGDSDGEGESSSSTSSNSSGSSSSSLPATNNLVGESLADSLIENRVLRNIHVIRNICMPRHHRQSDTQTTEPSAAKESQSEKHEYDMALPSQADIAMQIAKKIKKGKLGKKWNEYSERLMRLAGIIKEEPKEVSDESLPSSASPEESQSEEHEYDTLSARQADTLMLFAKKIEKEKLGKGWSECAEKLRRLAEVLAKIDKEKSKEVSDKSLPSSASSEESQSEEHDDVMPAGLMEMLRLAESIDKEESQSEEHDDMAPAYLTEILRLAVELIDKKGISDELLPPSASPEESDSSPIASDSGDDMESKDGQSSGSEDSDPAESIDS